jgi:hypothetical protein
VAEQLAHPGGRLGAGGQVALGVVAAELSSRATKERSILSDDSGRYWSEASDE